MPFSLAGRPGEDADGELDAEEERRKEEARERAEAEQAALEQLKEENPEAYEKHVRVDEEEVEGEGPEREAGAGEPGPAGGAPPSDKSSEES